MVKKLLLTFAFFIFSLTTFAQAPANDLCLDAIEVFCGDSLTGTTIDATQTGEPDPTCGGVSNGTSPGVWYTFAGNGDIVTVSLCGSPNDTQLQVFSGNCFSLSCVDGNDDFCGLQSEVTFVSDAFTTYYFYVNGFLNGAPMATFNINVTCVTPGPPPINDECDGAIVAPVNQDEFCNVFTQGTLVDATNSNITSNCPGTANDDVWFEFVAMSETQIIEIQNVTGTPTNLVHAVYEGTCDALVELSCSDPDQSTIGGLTIGETYFIRIYTFGNDPFNTVTFDLCIRLAPPPPANDLCVDAIAISCGEMLTGSTADATDTDEPDTLCGIFNNGTAPGVWYNFAGVDGSVAVSLCGSTFDTQLQVFSGDCDNLVCVAGNDDNFADCGAGGNSELFFDAVAGTNYLFYVNGFGANSGDFNIEVTCVLQPPTIDLVCADGDFDSTFCYENNSNVSQFFQGDTAFPLRLTINSGIVEAGDDFVVIDSDGVTNLNADNPFGNNGDLSGLVFTASGNSISLSVQSDASISCGDGANIPIDYTIFCLECTDPVATYAVLGDCDVSDQFTIEVNVTDVGTLNDLTVSDNQGSAPQNITSPGILTFGPYTANTTLVEFTLDPGDTNCAITSETFTLNCAIDCYNILDITDDFEVGCDVLCVDLSASFVSASTPGLSTTSYVINGPICDVPMVDGGTPTNITQDDTWTGVIDMTFSFNYFGTEYSSLVIGPNGQISFDLTLAGQFNGWNSEPDELLPFTDGNFPLNTIYGAFHDMDPSVNPDPTQINYFITGEPGSRMFVLNFNDVEQFLGTCNSFRTTQQIILFEGLNIIDVNLINKPLCLDWNDGLATVGLMGNDLSEFSVPDGRNTGAWEATNETWRFIPDGPLDPTVDTTFEWQDETGNVVGTELDITVCPPTFPATYSAVLTTTDANGVASVFTEDVVITRIASCEGFDCTDAQFFEGFGQGTVPEDHNFLPAPYTFDGSGQLDFAEYAVQNGLSPINADWHQNLEDHTPDDTNGNALLINPSNLAADAEFYRRELTVVPNTDYIFEMWVTTMYDTDSGPDSGDPTNFNVTLEDSAGAQIIASNTGSIPNQSEFQWLRFRLLFNSGTNTTLELVLENNNFGSVGNDFAIDDLGLFFEGTPPDIVTPDDLIGCDEDQDGFATYNLASQNDILLNGLAPEDFNITFHISEEDAMSGENAIVDPELYTNTSDPETIWVRVERIDQDTCFSVTQFMLIIGPLDDLGIVLPPLFEICSNEDFPALDGTVQNPDIDPTMIVYTWRDAVNTIVSTDAIFVPTVAGIYTLEVMSPACAINEFTTEVTVFEAPLLDLGMDESFCQGDEPFEIIPNITGDTTGITYLWSTGETTPTITVTSTDVYTLTINVDVCTVESSVAIEFLALPEVTLGEDFQTCPDMDTIITATVDSDDQSDLVFEYIGPDGNVIPNETGSTLVVQIPAGTTGASTYTVNVFNGNCVGSDSVDISLYDIDNCIISQGVSPNGDGINDTLDLQFLNDRSGIELFQIFNRFGRAVYEQRNYVNQWGGQTNDGDELPTGTYFYTIQLANDDPEFGTVATGWVYVNREE